MLYFTSYSVTDLLCIAASYATRFAPKISAATTEETIIKSSEMLYRQYRKRGYCDEKKNKRHASPYLFQPMARTFNAERSGKTVGTISLFPDSKGGLPADDICQPQLQKLREQGATLAEVGLLATEIPKVSAKYSLRSFRKLLPLFSLYRAIFDYASLIGISHLVISVNPKNVDIYKYIGFKQISEVDTYEGASGAPAVTFVLDLKEARANASTALRSFFLNNRTVINSSETLMASPQGVLGTLFPDLMNEFDSKVTAYGATEFVMTDEDLSTPVIPTIKRKEDRRSGIAQQTAPTVSAKAISIQKKQEAEKIGTVT